MRREIPIPQLKNINGDKYRLIETYPVKFVLWFRDYQFEIPEGFESDLASVPKPLRPFIDRASLGIISPLIHDRFCDLLGRIISMSGEVIQLTRFEVNILFLLTMLLDGVPFRRAIAAFIGVCIGAPRW